MTKTYKILFYSVILYTIIVMISSDTNAICSNLTQWNYNCPNNIDNLQSAGTIMQSLFGTGNSIAIDPWGNSITVSSSGGIFSRLAYIQSLLQ